VSEAQNLISNDSLAERIDGIRTLLNRVIGVGIAIGLATGSGAVAVYARTEVHQSLIMDIKNARAQERANERIAALEATRFTYADGAALQAGVNAKLDTLTKLVTEIQVQAARDGNGKH